MPPSPMPGEQACSRPRVRAGEGWTDTPVTVPARRDPAVSRSAVAATQRQTMRCIQPKVSSARPYWMSTSAWRICHA